MPGNTPPASLAGLFDPPEATPIFWVSDSDDDAGPVAQPHVPLLTHASHALAQTLQADQTRQTHDPSDSRFYKQHDTDEHLAFLRRPRTETTSETTSTIASRRARSIAALTLPHSNTAFDVSIDDIASTDGSDGSDEPAHEHDHDHDHQLPSNAPDEHTPLLRSPAPIRRGVDLAHDITAASFVLPLLRPLHIPPYFSRYPVEAVAGIAPDAASPANPIAAHSATSCTGHGSGTMTSGARRRRGSGPAYAGEDTRLTSNKEVYGWYAYAFASEVYVICAIASFIPILLESLARENGVLLSDHTTPCKASNAKSAADTVVDAVSASAASALFLRSDKAKSAQCIVYVFGLEVNTASFAMYSFSASVLLQALLVVSISCAADHGNYRKKLMLAFAWTGAVAVMLYIVVTSEHFLFGAFLAVVSNTAFGASFVLLNSFLPLLVRNHPRLVLGKDAEEHASDDASGDAGDDGDDDEPRQIQMHDDDDDDDVDGDDSLLDAHDPSAVLLPSDANGPLRSHEEQTSLELALSTQISSKGIGIGYCAALFLQCVSIFIVFRLHNTIWSQRVVLFVVGAWWLVFTVPAALWLRPRPGPPLPAEAIATNASGSGAVNWLRHWAAYLRYAWAQLYRTARTAYRLKDICLFLGGWFLLSDAIATTSSTAVLFAKTQLHMEVWALGMINVISTATGVLGAFLWPLVSRKLGLKPLHTIMACLVLFELIPLYGLAGYLPFVNNWGVGGLQQPWEMFPLAGVYGVVLGGVSSYCRSLFGELIPLGNEAAFYALYAITDKGSSVFGPSIVAAIIGATGEIRPAFGFLAVLVALAGVILYWVDAERGKRDGEKLASFIDGYPGHPEIDVTAANNTATGTRSTEPESPETPRPLLAPRYDSDD